MARRTGLILAALAATAAAPAGPVQALAGRYSWEGDAGQFGHIGGIAEIVPVDAAHAYVRVDLEFPSGFSCGISGVAAAVGPALVYREPRRPDGDAHCVLTIRRDGADLMVADGGGSCRSHCGMNGDLELNSLPWRSRRPITYLARLRHSAEYRQAIREWRTARPRR